MIAERTACRRSRPRALFGRRADVLAPQAARPCNPFQSNAPDAAGYTGYSWYLGDDAERPEAASLGDVLAELDLFVAALGRPFVLAGRGQGGVLAMTLALHAPENLAGVWCDGAALAQIEGWDAPQTALTGIPFVIANLDDLRSSRVREVVVSRGARLDAASNGGEAWLEAIGAEAPKP